MASAPRLLRVWPMACLGVLLTVSFPSHAAPASPALPPDVAALELQDPDGRPVRPFTATNATAFVFVFLSNDCPICNRYAPELTRLEQECRRRRVEFWLVHPLADESGATILQHAREYALPNRLLRDDRRVLARRIGITVTPEAALFDVRGQLVYRGRIDDRFPALGRQRPAATRHDLWDAVEAVLAGKPVSTPRTPAVGCVLPDLDERRP